MTGEKKEDQGVVDDIDYDPEFHEQEQDLAIEDIKKTNPKLYELMKNNGAEVDEEDVK